MPTKHHSYSRPAQDSQIQVAFSLHGRQDIERIAAVKHTTLEHIHRVVCAAITTEASRTARRIAFVRWSLDVLGMRVLYDLSTPITALVVSVSPAPLTVPGKALR